MRFICLFVLTAGVLSGGCSTADGTASGSSSGSLGSPTPSQMGFGDYGHTCARSADCQDTCVFNSFGSKGQGMCTIACTTVKDCPEGLRCESLDSSPKNVCFPSAPCTNGPEITSEFCAGQNASTPFALKCTDKQQVPSGCSDINDGDFCCPKKM